MPHKALSYLAQASSYLAHLYALYSICILISSYVPPTLRSSLLIPVTALTDTLTTLWSAITVSGVFTASLACTLVSQLGLGAQTALWVLVCAVQMLGVGIGGAVMVGLLSVIGVAWGMAVLAFGRRFRRGVRAVPGWVRGWFVGVQMEGDVGEIDEREYARIDEKDVRMFVGEADRFQAGGGRYWRRFD